VVRAEDGGEPSVQLTLKVTGGGGRSETIRENLKLSAAPEFLRVDVAARVSGQTRGEVEQALTAEEQFSALTARADAFAMLGSWQQSTGLREAAVLIKDDLSQRQKIIWEYSWIIKTRIRRESDVRVTCRRRVVAGRTALAHVGYMIRNRQLNLPEASMVSHNLVRDILRIREMLPKEVAAENMPEAKKDVRQFLRGAFVMALALKHASPYEKGRDEEIKEWGNLLCDNATENYQNDSYEPDDLDFLFVVMTEILPVDLHPPDSLVRFMASSPVFTGNTAISEDAYQVFLDKIIQSDRPANRILARYARLNRQWQHSKWGLEPENLDVAAFQTEVEQLIKDYEELAPHLRSRSSALTAHLKDLITQVRETTEPPTSVTKSSTGKSPVTAPCPVELEPIALSVRTLTGETIPFLHHRWENSQGGGTMHHLLTCGRGVDVFWHQGAIAVMQRAGLLEDILIAPESWIDDVKWDGHNLWVGTQQAGLWVVSLKGKVLARIGEKEGLPPADRSFRICSIAPGKVLAAGSLGEHERLWLAIVEHDGRQSRVNVFHQATRVMTFEDLRKGRPFDVDLAARPEWTHELNTGKKDGPRIILIGRSFRRYPLQVNLSTLKVSLYSQSVVGAAVRVGSRVSRDGRLYEAVGDNHLLVFGERLYEVNGGGRIWYRVDFEKGRPPIPMGRMPADRTLWFFGVSSYYGMVGWDHDGRFYRITVTKEARAQENPGGLGNDKDSVKPAAPAPSNR
ncbi:MAG TPA: hypothetical protein VM238_12160, partial [Phycisphaerae bacterium]|nr:hypothetical protein [Phycisphaerae bacterium]